MINIQNVLHLLHTKWMVRLCKDRGLSWSQIFWNKLENNIPFSLLPGLTAISEQDIAALS